MLICIIHYQDYYGIKIAFGTFVIFFNKDGFDSYEKDLSDAKSDFFLNFTGKKFLASSNISDEEDNNPK